MTRTLIGGVGYSQLTDHSFGPLFIARFQDAGWPDGVVVEDLFYGPLFIMHSLDEREPFDRMIFIGAVRRETTPGEIRLYRWNHELPDIEEVKARVVEAATGVTSLENLLVVGTYFKKFPSNVIVIEVEPEIEECGEHLSPALEPASQKVLELVRRILAGENEPLRAYDYIIADPSERPTGWIVRPAGEL